jgi:HD-GYP domain-containing protein (c-di-GMP phosphodiesterase class II)
MLTQCRDKGAEEQFMTASGNLLDHMAEVSLSRPASRNEEAKNAALPSSSTDRASQAPGSLSSPKNFTWAENIRNTSDKFKYAYESYANGKSTSLEQKASGDALLTPSSIHLGDEVKARLIDMKQTPSSQAHEELQKVQKELQKAQKELQRELGRVDGELYRVKEAIERQQKKISPYSPGPLKNNVQPWEKVLPATLSAQNSSMTLAILAASPKTPSGAPVKPGEKEPRTPGAILRDAHDKPISRIGEKQVMAINELGKLTGGSTSSLSARELNLFGNTGIHWIPGKLQEKDTSGKSSESASPRILEQPLFRVPGAFNHDELHHMTAVATKEEVEQEAVETQISKEAPLRQAEEAVKQAAVSIESVIKKSRCDIWSGDEMAAKLIYLLMKAASTFTFEHSSRVTDLSVALAKELGITDKEMLKTIEEGAMFHDIGEVEQQLSEAPEETKSKLAWYMSVTDLENCSLLHDIGKVKIPDSILYKPGKLTDEEFQVLKQHPVIGEEILKPIPSMAHVLPVVRHHHEKWDGRGYPDGLKGEESPLAARIVSITDAYDAMISDRPYRKGMPVEAAVAELKKCAGTQFDPRLADAFLKVIEGPWNRAGMLSGWKAAEGSEPRENHPHRI